MNDKTRCIWCQKSDLEQKYHDNEWGIPLHDEKALFEFLCLEGAQAGLSWSTILNKRENYRLALDDFDVEKIAKYTDVHIERLLADSGIVRNKLKIKAFITNAKAFIRIQEKHGSFDKYFWAFNNFKTIQNKYLTPEDIPTETPLSQHISRILKKDGFTFVGPTIIYAYMQAIGMVNDHTTNCYRHTQLS